MRYRERMVSWAIRSRPIEKRGHPMESEVKALETSVNRPKVGFTHHIVFQEVMRREPVLAKELLERVLGFQIERVELVQTEHAVDAHLSSRGVRFDLYAKGSDKVIDVELQATEEPDLGRRMRYYQGALDASVLSKGAKYRGLPESYIVFLCRRDPFERSIPRYTIELVCEEDDIELRADMHWLVYNAEASRDEMDPKLRNLLSFIQDGTAAQGDPFIEGIAAQVDRINEDEEVMAMIFTMQDEIELQADLAYEKGIAEGEARGEARGKAEGKAEGENRLSRLMALLFEANRLEDAERVATDPAYREQLFKELAIA